MYYQRVLSTQSARNPTPELQVPTASRRPPAEASNPAPVIAEFTFGAGTPSEFTARAPPAAPLLPAGPPTASSGQRKTLPSPWLPPRHITNLQWDIDNYNVHERQTLEWPLSDRVPESFVWEHPAMHGLLVDASGQTTQNQVREPDL